MQEAQEAAAKAEAQGLGGLGLVAERGVVQGQAVERVAEVLVAVGVEREQAAEDHRLHLAVAGQRLGRRLPPAGQRVADSEPGDVLDPGDHVAHLPRAHSLRRSHLRHEEADLVDLGLGPGLHGRDPLALAEGAVHEPDVRDHSAIGVELGVEDQRPRRGVRLSPRRRDPGDDRLQHLLDALARLGRDPQHLVGIAADQVGDLGRHPLRLGARQVDLVEHGNQLQPGLDRRVGVGDRLRLDALSGVDDQQRPLTGGEAARDLVGEIHVPRGVDQVQVVGLAVAGPVGDPNRLRLDRDPALALELHRVEELRPVLGADGARQLEQPVGERRLAVVDVGDDREVADPVHGVEGLSMARGPSERPAEAPQASRRRTSRQICSASGIRSRVIAAAYTRRPRRQAGAQRDDLAAERPARAPHRGRTRPRSRRPRAAAAAAATRVVVQTSLASSRRPSWRRRTIVCASTLAAVAITVAATIPPTSKGP